MYLILTHIVFGFVFFYLRMSISNWSLPACNDANMTRRAHMLLFYTAFFWYSHMSFHYVCTYMCAVCECMMIECGQICGSDNTQNAQNPPIYPHRAHIIRSHIRADIYTQSIQIRARHARKHSIYNSLEHVNAIIVILLSFTSFELTVYITINHILPHTENSKSHFVNI